LHLQIVTKRYFTSKLIEEFGKIIREET